VSEEKTKTVMVTERIPENGMLVSFSREVAITPEDGLEMMRLARVAAERVRKSPDEREYDEREGSPRWVDSEQSRYFDEVGDAY
jgi:hypothetical protein